jgi:hypothetical protein
VAGLTGALLGGPGASLAFVLPAHALTAAKISGSTHVSAPRGSALPTFAFTALIYGDFLCRFLLSAATGWPRRWLQVKVHASFLHTCADVTAPPARIS